MTRPLCSIAICASLAVAVIMLARSSAFSVSGQPRQLGAESQIAGLQQSNSAQFLAAYDASSSASATSVSGMQFMGAFLAVGLGAMAVRTLVGAKAKRGSPKTAFVPLTSTVEPVFGGYFRDQLVACRAQLNEAGAPSVEEFDKQIDELKNHAVAGAAAALVVSTSAPAGAYPIFAQQNYKNPVEYTGKVVCANCHLRTKSISVKMPHEVLPDTIFKINVHVQAKYDIKRQLDASGNLVEMNVGALVELPEGFKLAPRDRLPKSLKKEMKGLAWAQYSKEKPNIVVAGPVPGNTYSNLILPVLAGDPAKDKEVKWGKLETVTGGNRGRGQVYPAGNMSNNNQFQSPATGTITAIEGDKTKRTVTVVKDSDGSTVTSEILAGATMIVDVGEKVVKDQALTTNPNVGGFGQEDHDIVLQDPNRVFGGLALGFSFFISQLSFVLKKKQFEKVQLAEGF